MEPSLFDPMTLVFAQLEGADLFHASCVCQLWSKVFDSEGIWRHRFQRDVTAKNLTEKGDKSLNFRQRYRNFLQQTLITEINIGGPAFKAKESRKGEADRDLRVPYTLKSGIGIPEIPFNWVEGFTNAVFGEMELSHIAEGKAPWHDANAFIKACGQMLTLLSGKDTKPPKENDPLPKNVKCELRGLTMFFGLFYNPDDLTGTNFDNGEHHKKEDGIDFFLSLNIKDVINQQYPAEKFAIYLVFRHVKQYLQKLKKAQRKRKLGGIHSHPYTKKYDIPWRITRKIFHWDSLLMLGRNYEENIARDDEWQPIFDAFTNELEPSNAFLRRFSVASKYGKIGTAIWEDPLKMRELFRHPGVYDFNANVNDVLKEVIEADLEGRKVKQEDLVAADGTMLVERPPPPQPFRPPAPRAPDFEVIYVEQLSQLAEMGYRNRKAMIDALKASNGDLIGALGFLADENNPASKPVVDPLLYDLDSPQMIVARPTPPPVQPQIPPAVDARVKYRTQLETIRSIGIDDEARAISALDRAKGNVDHAIAILFGD